MPVKKVVVRGLVAVLLAGMALVLGGDPAHAQMPAGCRVDIGLVYEENEYINGELSLVLVYPAHTAVQAPLRVNVTWVTPLDEEVASTR
ncbi:hypothetical protein DFJ67_7195 [Asanoa ferruginea]|uniref:Uncharacterized protein n=1 Tax=Asanoa ferruginea TaxID=53367 RepID=A0A3D9ZUU0_9ACTN|nr:hypothetical protein DFJ67_7195 [Asanoa ferruginea]GIF47181.1 hypothetical protein Afe04nite_17200 [Asanoa ferruginea]